MTTKQSWKEVDLLSQQSAERLKALNSLREERAKVESGEAKGQRCEVWSRVVGYLRPVSGWNDGKKEEFKDRKLYKIEGFDPDDEKEKHLAAWRQEQYARIKEEMKDL